MMKTLDIKKSWDVENYMIGEKGEKITKEEYNKKRKEVLEQLLK